MANSKLVKKNTYYKVPQYIIDEINLRLLKHKDIPSSTKQKAKNIARNKFLSYENLKRIKNRQLKFIGHSLRMSLELMANIYEKYQFTKRTKIVDQQLNFLNKFQIFNI